MNAKIKKELIDNMVDNLPALRGALELSQRDLAMMLDVSRQQIVSIENKKRKLSWPFFLALVCIFSNNEKTSSLLCVFNINCPDLHEFLSVCGKKRVS